jgi:Protein-tyrosine-phosphatase
MSEEEAGPARILVVCTGNVCRSPFIERYLRQELRHRWPFEPGVDVSSAGTAALVGQPIDERAGIIAAKASVDTTGFVSRQLTDSMIADADLILTATLQHRGIVVSRRPDALRRTFALRELPRLLAGAERGRPAELVADGPSWLSEVARIAGSRRASAGLMRAEDVDVVDPYRRRSKVYAKMATQIISTVPQLARLLSGDTRDR